MDTDPIETLPRVHFDELKVGMHVLAKRRDSPKKVVETIGPIQEIREFDSDKRLVFVNSLSFAVARSGAFSAEIYKYPQKGSRRTRKQKRSRRVKGGRVRTRTHRVRTLRR